MNLPNAQLAVVEQEKIVGYLLNAAHPDNGGKAAFFLSLGFSADNWQTLAASFRKAAENHPVKNSVVSPHGAKYVIDCKIATPSGRTPRVRMVWIIDAGRSAPRLVTAYPQDN